MLQKLLLLNVNKSFCYYFGGHYCIYAYCDRYMLCGHRDDLKNINC